jgi:hypothetical protein
MGGPRRAEMIQRANGRTSVPQIFIDGKHIGGSDDLAALDRQGGLDPLAGRMKPVSSSVERAALLQMTSGIDPAANASTLVEGVEQAKAGGAAMLFTPEMSGLLDRDRDRAAGSLVREEDDRVLAAVRDAAAKHGLWVHLGSLAVLREDGKLANRGFVIDDTGAIRARYDKMHLFDVDLPSGESWRESNSYAPGERAVTVADAAGRAGAGDLLRSALPGPVPRAERCRRDLAGGAGGVHPADRRGALAGAAARPRDRGGGIRDRGGADRRA